MSFKSIEIKMATISVKKSISKGSEESEELSVHIKNEHFKLLREDIDEKKRTSLVPLVATQRKSIFY